VTSTSDRLPRERLAELVSAAAYGTVLVLAALSALSVSDVAHGHGAELVAGVGVATWLAHLFAELLGRHVRNHDPLRGGEVTRALVDGSPILASTVLPALVLLTGRLDLVADRTAKSIAVVVAAVQLASIGLFVARRAPAPRRASWIFASLTAGAGLLVGALTMLLGH
jgi:hypothetical protein